MLEQIILDGAIMSLMYSLFALGFTLIYGVSGIVNMMHGAFFIIGAYVFGALCNFFPSFFPAEFLFIVPVLALILASLLTGIIGSITYRLTLHQIIGDEVAIIVVSMLGCIIVAQIVLLVAGYSAAQLFRVSSILPGAFTVLNVSIKNGQALAAVVSLLLFASLWIFLAKTRTGKAMKALSQDLEAAMLVGVSVEKMYMLTSAIAAGLACIAAVFFASSVTGGASTFLWIQSLTISFTIVILGGLGSLKGTLIGGVIYGYGITAITLLYPNLSLLTSSVPLIIMIIVIIIRPKGLFGKRIEME